MGQKKGGRGRGGGGGRQHQVTSAEDMNKRDENQERYNKARAARRADGEDVSDDDDAEGEDGDKEDRKEQIEKLADQFVGSVDVDGAPKPKKKGVVEGFEVANPNAMQSHTKSIKASAMVDSVEAPELTRREREELDKQRKAEHYKKLHAEGKTDEAKADNERLKEVRRRREEIAAAAKEAKEDEPAPEAPKRRDEAAADDDDDAINARTAKSLKPAQLKDELKKRNLSTQGQKKDLLARLIEAL